MGTFPAPDQKFRRQLTKADEAFHAGDMINRDQFQPGFRAQDGKEIKQESQNKLIVAVMFEP